MVFTLTPEQHSAAAARGGRKGAETKRAQKKAKSDAFRAQVIAERQSEKETATEDSEPIVILDLDEIPIPSPDLSHYDSEADRQLAFGRYHAACARRLEVETKKRQRIPIDEVRAWCAAVLLTINRRLPAVQTWADALPGATDEQRAWLRTRAKEWDVQYRESLARDVIE